MNKRLFETHIGVTDLDRSMTFYEEIMGLALGHKDEDRHIAFYWIGDWGESMLGLWEKPAGQIAHEHFAIVVEVDALKPTIADLRAKGIITKDFFGAPTDIPSFFAWVPAASIYFDDPDGHLLEYIAMLPGDPNPKLGVTSWDG